jgi:hypothetical protein
MGVRQVIEVALPEHAEAGADELAVLRSTLEAIVGLRFEEGGAWRETLKQLRAAGWSVDCGLQWHVVARSGREREEAYGVTRDEAFARLAQVTHAKTVEGTP